MKRFGNLLIVFALIAIAAGCGKDDNNGPHDNPHVFGNPASYEVKLDGEILIKKNDGHASISEVTNDINSGLWAYAEPLKVGGTPKAPEESVSVTDIHNLKVGESMPIGIGNNLAEVGVIKSFSKKEIYSILSGTVTREAENKISFTSTRIEYYKDGQQEQKDANLSGYIISDEVKKIGKKDKN